ncbi:MAG: ABC transporter permease subunit [Acidobacteria bacterium]|nr:MAG: ABC transporter permease subunit [Acidobacteriota bacterium]
MSERRQPAEQPSGARGGPWSLLPLGAWPHVSDIFLFAAVFAGIYAFAHVASNWLGPAAPHVVIESNPWFLFGYAGASLLRMLIAYVLSLAFAIAYGYWAASSATAERLLIPLLDILQSIPVLSFLPGVMLGMVALFPGQQIGIEMGAILLIFTGQVWNLAFSFYASLRSIPSEMREASRLYGFTWWQRYRQIEMPAATIGLVWNSMMSVAGGWFFLMACEQFELGNRDFRLPGLGSYLQTAAGAGDTHAILWGIAAMVIVIVLLDQVLWRPLIAWSQKFKLEQGASAESASSWMLDWLRQSQMLARLHDAVVAPLTERIAMRAARIPPEQSGAPPSGVRRWARRSLAAAGILVIAYAVARAAMLLGGLSPAEVADVGKGLGTTLVRVFVTLAIGAAWAIPTGVAIGLNPRLARIAQPLAQIAASIPATALFPVVLLLLIGWGRGMELAAIVLMLLGTQWYILFNVIAGATALPTELREAARVFRFRRWDRWRRLILPGIFPYLVTGLITASGGAWNASIIAEYFHFRGRIFATVGIGALISHATDTGNFRLLLAATVALAVVVVLLNRLVWRPLYRLADTRFRLEG